MLFMDFQPRSEVIERTFRQCSGQSSYEFFSAAYWSRPRTRPESLLRPESSKFRRADSSALAWKASLGSQRLFLYPKPAPSPPKDIPLRDRIAFFLSTRGQADPRSFSALAPA